ncbi:MAG: hypothetical protein GY855_04570 [candidate division Zixibacteria bacterium]|nr:hypothetical protein [candidate division Zixibacteria bacterium]
MENEKREIYDRLNKEVNIKDLDIIQTINDMGILIDTSLDLKEVKGLKSAINNLEKILILPISRQQESIIYYYLGNAWSSLRIITKEGKDDEWAWEQNEVENEFRYYRLALRDKESIQISKERFLPLYTNLGNSLQNLGRFICANYYYNEALKLDPEFGVALGNKGYNLYLYAYSFRQTHKEQSGILYKYAIKLLDKATKCKMHDGADNYFLNIIEHIKSQLKSEYLKQPISLSSQGSIFEETERIYRAWCLENSLFLNPLNDLGNFEAAAKDILSCPRIIVRITEGPYYHGIFNQLKQEYCSARYILYEGLNNKNIHFSDKNVTIVDTLDCSVYSLNIEKVKLSFRTAYSLLDKMAFFLNHYFNLKINDKKVSFRTLWYKKNKQVLREEFIDKHNLPLRGLFWLSKDIHENIKGLDTALDPEARKLREIRHHIEHKYLKVHGELWSGNNDKTSSGIKDTLAYSLYRADFEKQTLNLFRIIRSAIIYLTLSIEIEERIKKTKRKPEEKIVSNILRDIPDEWKE